MTQLVCQNVRAKYLRDNEVKKYEFARTVAAFFEQNCS